MKISQHRAVDEETEKTRRSRVFFFNRPSRCCRIFVKHSFSCLIYLIKAALVVQKVGSPIHRINHYPADNGNYNSTH